MAAIRSFLETRAMEQQRVLCSLTVDGQPLSATDCVQDPTRFTKVEARSIDLAHLPIQLVRTAAEQTAKVRQEIASAVALVLINDSRKAREHWWDLARTLKQPLLTLALLPSSACGPSNGGASLLQLRRWQLQQLATIIKEVDESCWSADATGLSNALERRVLPWLDGLRATLELWHETLAVWPEPRPVTSSTVQHASKTKHA
ncbi:MAG: hypothetical protein ACREIC_08745 [Limisphaerales bacterium]